jgi:hypothetical protein
MLDYVCDAANLAQSFINDAKRAVRSGDSDSAATDLALGEKFYADASEMVDQIEGTPVSDLVHHLAEVRKQLDELAAGLVRHP